MTRAQESTRVIVTRRNASKSRCMSHIGSRGNIVAGTVLSGQKVLVYETRQGIKHMFETMWITSNLMLSTICYISYIGVSLTNRQRKRSQRRVISVLQSLPHYITLMCCLHVDSTCFPTQEWSFHEKLRRYLFTQ